VEIVSKPKTERFGLTEWVNDEDPVDQESLIIPLAFHGQISKENFDLITPEVLSDMIAIGLDYGEFVYGTEIKQIRNNPYKVYMLDYNAMASKVPLLKIINSENRLYYY